MDDCDKMCDLEVGSNVHGTKIYDRKVVMNDLGGFSDREVMSYTLVELVITKHAWWVKSRVVVGQQIVKENLSAIRVNYSFFCCTQ